MIFSNAATFRMTHLAASSLLFRTSRPPMLIDSIRHFAAFSGNHGSSTRSTRSASSRNLMTGMPRKKQRLMIPNRGRCFSTSSSSATSDEDSDSDRVTSKLSSSTRAGAAVELLPTYLSDARAVQRYHPTDAPDGALQLCVAENQMLEDLLVPALSSFSSAPTSFAADMIYYQPTHGRPSARIAMARYLERTLGGLQETLHQNEQSLDPEGLVMGAGCNAVLENLCICLADAGDAVLIPTPYYAAFEFDLVARAALSIVPVDTMKYHPEVEDNGSALPKEIYFPNRSSLDAAYEAAEANGSPPKILLLSHPNNPLGICYPASVMQECIDWCRERQVHLVSDEIYAGSVYRHETDGEEPTFTSALALGATTGGDAEGLGLGNYVHFVYAFSKDFALSGLRVGVAYSENPDIRLPFQKLNDLCQISSTTQQLVETMVTATCPERPFWTDHFLAENQSRILNRCRLLQATLDECGVPYLSATAGLFVWMDMRQFLPSSGTKEERERTLYLELLKDNGLLVTPGLSMRHEHPGFFRCVFTPVNDEEFDLGLQRIRNFVASKRK